MSQPLSPHCTRHPPRPSTSSLGSSLATGPSGGHLSVPLSGNGTALPASWGAGKPLAMQGSAGQTPCGCIDCSSTDARQHAQRSGRQLPQLPAEQGSRESGISSSRKPFGPLAELEEGLWGDRTGLSGSGGLPRPLPRVAWMGPKWQKCVITLWRPSRVPGLYGATSSLFSLRCSGPCCHRPTVSSASLQPIRTPIARGPL